MKILVTGGAGFVGRHFVTKFLETQNDDVLVLDTFYTGIPVDQWAFQPRYRERLKIRQMDVRVAFRDKKFKPDDFDLIVHCAAIVGGRLNIENDPLAVATDLSIDAEFFDWVVRGEYLPRVVYFSSSAVYPNSLQTRQTHCHLNEALVNFDGTRIGIPDMTYGWAKLSGEYLAKFAADKYGLPVAIYRPFGGYGEDQDFSYPFPSIIRRIIQKENPITVWGSGEQERDFIHIDDIVDGVLQTMYRLKPGAVLNLGCGVAVSFKELAMLACEILGHKADIFADTSKPEGVFSRVSESWAMMNMYRPKVTLEQGIERVAQHIQNMLVTT